MSRFGDAIATQVARWGDPDLPLERQLFGTTDPDGIAAAVDAWCREHLRAGIDHYVRFDSSSGSVHSVVLTDGRAVVVKGHRPEVAPDYLAAVADLQRDLAGRGYPAPLPRTGPVACGRGHVVAEAMLEHHRPDDPYAPGVRDALATGLARFVALARDHRDALVATGHAMDVSPGALYPAPHSARFDFAATAAGAEWIDDLARAARARLAADRSPGVVVHGDWRVQNVSVRADAVDAVFDWDSVRVADELTALAAAALTFGVDWERDETRFPSPPETAAFVAAYEGARGGSLTAAERDRIAVAMVATMAYGARCEHADPTAARSDQRDRLHALGPPLLIGGLSALTA